MDVIQFVHENNKDYNHESEDLIHQESEMNNKNNKHNLIVILPNNNNKSLNLKSDTKSNEESKKKELNNYDSASNSFTDYSSIDCDSLTDSSNIWQQNGSKRNKDRINDVDGDDDNEMRVVEINLRNENNNTYRPIFNNNANQNEEIQEEQTNINNVNNSVNTDKENEDAYNYEATTFIRPKKSRSKKPLLAEILNNYENENENDNTENEKNEKNEKNENDYEGLKIISRPDRPTTRRGRSQEHGLGTESRNSRESDYVQLSNVPVKKTNSEESKAGLEESKNNADLEIKEELEVFESKKTNHSMTPKLIINNDEDKSSDAPKIVEVFTFEENNSNENEAIYTPPLPIEEENDTIQEENDTVIEDNEYVTIDKIVKSSKENSRQNESINSSFDNKNSNNLPKIKTMYSNVSYMKNTRQASTKTERSLNNNSPYSKYREFQSGRVTMLSNFKDFKLLQNREKYNMSRNTNKSTDSKTTFNTYNSSATLHSRKMNQDELLKSVNRLSYVPKRSFEHQRFTTLHDKFSNVDTNAVSLRLYNSKSHKIKEKKQNDKRPNKSLNKIEIDKMVRILLNLILK